MVDVLNFGPQNSFFKIDNSAHNTYLIVFKAQGLIKAQYSITDKEATQSTEFNCSYYEAQVESPRTNKSPYTFAIRANTFA